MQFTYTKDRHLHKIKSARKKRSGFYPFKAAGKGFKVFALTLFLHFLRPIPAPFLLSPRPSRKDHPRLPLQKPLQFL